MLSSPLLSRKLLALLLLVLPLLQPADSGREADLHASTHLPLALLQHVSIESQPLSASQRLHAPLAAWNFTLPASALRKGVGYTGSNHRLRRVLKDAAHGRPIKLGFLGGSITWGDESSKRGVTDWASLVGRWAQSSFPNVTYRNGAVPATQSSYMAMCMEHAVDTDTDIVFLEYLVNDAYESRIKNNQCTAGYERLVRRALSLPNKPAVILIQTWRHGQTFSRTGMYPRRPFDEGLETVYSAVAQYYSLQYASFMTATERLERKNVPGFSYVHLMGHQGTSIHPADPGHKVLADLAVYTLQLTLLDLALRPWEASDTQQLAEPLPPPMMPGNEVPASSTCLQGPSLRTAVTSHQGWDFMNEGTVEKPKTGYVTTTPGTKLVLTLDTLRPGTQGDVGVNLGYLKSYQHMGQAMVRCDSGCNCTDTVINAHHTIKTSQSYLKTISVSQHPKCVMSVTVLEATHSGERKFKVTSVIVNDAPGKSKSIEDGSVTEPVTDKQHGVVRPGG